MYNKIELPGKSSGAHHVHIHGGLISLVSFGSQNSPRLKENLETRKPICPLYDLCISPTKSQTSCKGGKKDQNTKRNAVAKPCKVQPVKLECMLSTEKIVAHSISKYEPQLLTDGVTDGVCSLPAAHPMHEPHPHLYRSILLLYQQGKATAFICSASLCMSKHISLCTATEKTSTPCSEA